jgi:hypothetical protein
MYYVYNKLTTIFLFVAIFPIIRVSQFSVHPSCQYCLIYSRAHCTILNRLTDSDETPDQKSRVCT